MVWVVFFMALAAVVMAALALARPVKAKPAEPVEAEEADPAEEEMRRFSAGVAQVLSYEIRR